MAPSEPNVVYALIQADYKGQAGGLFRSDHAGQTWTLVNNSMDITQRAFYYMDGVCGSHGPRQDLPAQRRIAGIARRRQEANRPASAARRQPMRSGSIQTTPKSSLKAMMAARPSRKMAARPGVPRITSRPGSSITPISTINSRSTFTARSRTGVRTKRRAPCLPGISPVWKTVQGGEMSWLVPTPGQPWVTYGSGYYSMEWKENRGTGLATNVSPWPSYKFGLAGTEIKYRYGWNHHPVVFAPPNLKNC